MMPQYFGAENERLFGVYQEPTHGTDHDHGVVLCYPLWQEYVRSHRAYQRLAVMLARQGHHVFRFDYFGSGDSSGSSDGLTIAACLDNIATAIDELKDVAGVSRVSLVGLRFGATLAALVGGHRVPCHRLVLWDPVVVGADYMNGLHGLRDKVMTACSWRRRRPNGLASIGAHQLLGFPVPEPVAANVSAADLLSVEKFPARRALVVGSSDKPSYKTLVDHMERRGTKTSYQVVEDDDDWDEFSKYDFILVPPNALSAITAYLAAG